MPGPLPSQKWSSFDNWDYNGMRQRLEETLRNINKSAIIQHAQHIKGLKLKMSEPFSAGQYWICLELVAEDGSLVMARVRLPRHPEVPETMTDEEEHYLMQCEVATMRYIKEKLPDVPIPTVYAFAQPGSQLAMDAGAPYMLIEGFYGNSLLDVEFDMTMLPLDARQRIITKWTDIQVQLAQLTQPKIGSISGIDSDGNPIIGKLATASLEGLESAGPFSTAVEYLVAAGEAAVAIHSRDEAGSTCARTGALIFCDVVRNTDLFKSMGDKEEVFPLNHMDMGTQNILIDDDFNVSAVIDWEFAQFAPWQTFHYPMPFPLRDTDSRIQEILSDSESMAHKNVVRQQATRKLYRDGFARAEEEANLLSAMSLDISLANMLESPASRVYYLFTLLGRQPEADEQCVQVMVEVAYGWSKSKRDEYIQSFMNE